MTNKLLTDEPIALRATTKKADQKAHAPRGREARRARSERAPVADSALWRAMTCRPHGPFSLLGQRD